MKEIPVSQITETVARLCIEANVDLGSDVEEAFRKMREAEPSPTGKEVLDLLLKNAAIAREERMPICQDTGLAVVFIEVGQEVHFTGGGLEEAIHEGVRQGYEKGYLRKSTCHPFTRKNLGDNTPAIIHTRIVPGDTVRIIVEPKGGGSENMSRVVMLTPSQGIDGVRSYVIQRVKEAGSNPCPPIVVGDGNSSRSGGDKLTTVKKTKDTHTGASKKAVDAPKPQKKKQVPPPPSEKKKDKTPEPVAIVSPKETAKRVRGRDFKLFDLYKVQILRPERSGYGVQVASLSNYANVMKQVAELQEKWFNNILISVEKGKNGEPIYKVLLGPFPNKKIAKGYEKQLKKKKKIDGFIVDLSAIKY